MEMIGLFVSFLGSRNHEYTQPDYSYKPTSIEALIKILWHLWSNLEVYKRNTDSDSDNVKKGCAGIFESSLYAAFPSHFYINI